MPPSVDARGLTIGYGERAVLRDLSFTVEPGQMVGIVGPNGCGKSTLLKTILGALRPLSGDLHLAGIAPSQMVSASVRRLRGYLPNIPLCVSSMSPPLTKTRPTRHWLGGACAT